MNKRTHGAVSVFLVIILVPCLLFTSVFIDLSRVLLSKGLSNSASDLALNSLMTNYDADLNDWYGMVASCQSIDEFYDESAKFFLRAIKSQDIPDDDIVLLADYYAHLTENKAIYDLIKSDVVSDVTIKPVEGADLSNPGLIKDQIIEFMKYRAPIEITRDLISRFKNDDGSMTEEAEAIVDSEENNELVESKQTFYKTEEELMKDTYKSYCAVYDYYSKSKSYGFTNQGFQDRAKRMNEMRDIYFEIHKAYVYYLANTSGLTQYTRVNYALNLYQYSSDYNETSNKVYTKRIKGENGMYEYHITKERIDDLLVKLNKAIEDFETAISNYHEAGYDIANVVTGTAPDQANEIQLWVRLNSAVNSGNSSKHNSVANKALAMLQAYQRVVAIEKCIVDEPEPEPIESNNPSLTDDPNATPTPTPKPTPTPTPEPKLKYPNWESTRTTLMNKVANYQAKYLTKDKTDGNDKYLVTVNKLEKLSKNNINKINSSSVMVKYDLSERDIANAISTVAGELSAMKDGIDEIIKLLDKAIDGGGWLKNNPKSLDKIGKLADKYQSDFRKWEGEANKQTTSMQKDDYMSIHRQHKGEDKDYKNIDDGVQNIDKQAYMDLKSRLTNIRGQFDKLLQSLNSLQYGGKKIREIDKLKTFIGCANTEIKNGDIPLKNGELDEYIKKTFNKLYRPSEDSKITIDHLGDVNYDPDIDPTKSTTPELFAYLYKKFGVPGKSDAEEKADKLDKDNGDADSKKDEYAEEQKANNAKFRGNKEKNISISYSSSESQFTLLEDGMLNSIKGMIETIVSGNLYNLRDDLYTTTYIMHMFSYATHDREGIYKLMPQSERKKLGISNVTDNFESSDKYKEYRGAADKKGTWLSTSMADINNKTLTNKMIDSSNNPAYLAEVEYILYGQATSEENVKKSFEKIYLLRYTLNLISAFQHFWSHETINAIATALSTATSGIIPPAAIKIVLLPILTVFETCMDQTRLAHGLPVEIYKASKDDWWIKPPNVQSSVVEFVSSLVEPSSEDSIKNKDKGLFYSDYLMIFVYLGLSGHGELEENMYKRIAEVIEYNMSAKPGISGSEKKYSLSNSKVYFRLEATIRVKPLMITLPIFSDYDETTQKMTESHDWCTYKVNTVRGYS